MNKITNPKITEAFESYPKQMRSKVMLLRQLVLDTASETEGIHALEETLKWGEPSYLSKNGSTIRVAWKASAPDQYAMYFNCQTTLVDTFRELYRGKLKFEGNRAIVFYKEDEILVDELKHCISLALTYHLIKHLPMLGV